MDFVFWYNVIEAVLWTGFALLTASFGHRLKGLTLRLRIAFALAFLAFGLSDALETRTGAWWRPFSLLVFKGLCLTALVLCSAWVWKNRRVGAAQRNPPSS
ncbi:MAG TPA: hypothetical protein VFT74_05815 [Isosphaeraceae bacterium]|nr:hypothetical protein [Isosphaeraceae bacterium]